MYNEKRCIVILFDPSYIIHRIDIPMAYIYELITRHKNDYIIYGGIDRLCSHVEEYAKVYKIPKERLINICVPYRCSRGFISMDVTSKWLEQILEYNPDLVYVFRDNNTIGMTTSIIKSCIDKNIKVKEYNNKGFVRDISYSTTDVSKYYRTRPGAVVP